MTAMCWLVHRHMSRRNTRALVSYLFQRQNSAFADHRVDTLGMKHFVSGKPLQKEKAPVKTKYLSYIDMLKMRREEAQRTILVEIEGVKDSAGLKAFCQRFGRVGKHYLYRAAGKNFVLVEFVNGSVKNSILNTSFHSKDPQAIPVTSPFLYFHHSENVSGNPLTDSTNDLRCDEEQMLQELKSLQCNENMRLQTEINHIHKKSQISDLSTRLRFFTCHQLDLALSGLFSGIRALPFGSSLCGFGRNTGDLDIFLDFKKNINMDRTMKKAQLYFLSKASVKDKNLQLKVIGDLISIMLPGCCKVNSILSARVPIIKYKNSLSNLECDINISAASGIDLTHIMWLMNQWDPRVAPLVFALRMWANQTKIGAKGSSPLLTNFGLTYMIIFFLQNKNILPSLQALQNIKGASQSFDPRVDLVFPDIQSIPSKNLHLNNSTQDSVDTLLCSFFDFYSNFDFDKHKISILSGIQIPKTATRPLEIENPVDPYLNISQNVTQDGLGVLKNGLLNARTALGDNYETKSIRVIFPNANLPRGEPVNQSRPHSKRNNRQN